MLNKLIIGIVYVQFDEIHGTNPVLWMPSNLSEKLRMLVGIKSISMLTGEESHIPKSVLIFPFPSQNLKSLVKFLKWEDKTRRGGEAVSVIAVLFEEINDVIFYKYRSYLESAFDEAVRKIIKLETKKESIAKVKDELNLLQSSILSILEDLRIKEEFKSETVAFPEAKAGDDEISDYRFKIIVCGDPGVGKTSTILRFTDNAFTTNYIPTLGVNVSEKVFKLGKDFVELIIFDIAGQAKFQRMRKHFYEGAEGVLLVFDLTRQDSFDSIEKWYKDIKKHLGSGRDIIGYVIGNKQDLVEERKILKENALTLIKKCNLDYIETSALTGQNIDEVFFKIAEDVIKS